MKVPVQVTIGGHVISIEYVDSLPDSDGDATAGESSALARYIKISKQYHQTAAALQSTIFHELCHIAIGLCGHDELLGERSEEAIVLALENMLAPILSIQPTKLVKFAKIKFPWE